MFLSRVPRRTGIRARPRARRLVLALVAVLALLLGLLAPTSAEAGPVWKRFATAGTPSGQQVYWQSMSATGPTDVWAAGYRVVSLPGVTEFRTWVQHWDGTTWTTVSTPDVESAPAVNLLNRVAAASPTAAWAVGSYQRSDSTWAPLVLRWDGSVWSRSDIPVPSASQSYLQSVAATSPTDVWAVGTYRDAGSFTDRPWSTHFDGSTWSTVTVPRPAVCVGDSLAVADVASAAGRVVLSGSCGVTGGTTSGFVAELVGGAWRSRGTIPHVDGVAGLAIASGGSLLVGADTAGNTAVVIYRRTAGAWVAGPALTVGRSTTIENLAVGGGVARVDVVGSVTATDNGVSPLLATWTSGGGWVTSTSRVSGFARALAEVPGGGVWAAGVDYQAAGGFFLRRAG